MQRNAFALLDTLFRHQTERERKSLQFTGYFRIDGDALPIDKEMHLIFALRVAYTIAVLLPRMCFDGQFVEERKILGLYGVLDIS
jgi:hypothetical protein